MIGTGINDAQQTFAGADLELHRLSDEDPPPSKRPLGTAIATRLTGVPGTRACARIFLPTRPSDTAPLLVPAFGNHEPLVSFVARGVTFGLRDPALERSLVPP
ncbi:hypothetical protein [Ponticoccus alexandrii]|nr:hypothetical protein [Ponticoccus alexandrii]